MAAYKESGKADLAVYAKKIDITLDVSSSIPRYYQLFRILSQFIRTHNLSPGYRLPSEDEIAGLFNVSRPTVQKAIQGLISQGCLVREKGRGTFIREVVNFSLDFFGDNIHFSQQFSSTRDSKITIIKTAVAPADDDTAKALALQPAEPAISIRRLFEAHNHPVMVVDSTLSHIRFPGIEKNLIADKDIYNVLNNNYNLTIDNTDWRIEAGEVMEEELAGLLRVAMLSRRGMSST